MSDIVFILYKFVQNNNGGYDKLLHSVYYDLNKCKEGAEKLLEYYKNDPHIKNIYYIKPLCRPDEFTCSWEYLNFDRDVELVRITQYTITI